MFLLIRSYLELLAFVGCLSSAKFLATETQGWPLLITGRQKPRCNLSRTVFPWTILNCQSTMQTFLSRIQPGPLLAKIFKTNILGFLVGEEWFEVASSQAFLGTVLLRNTWNISVLVRKKVLFIPQCLISENLKIPIIESKIIFLSFEYQLVWWMVINHISGKIYWNQINRKSSN